MLLNNTTPWFKTKKWKKIGEDIMKIVYQNLHHTNPKYEELESKLAILFQIEVKILKWLNSFIYYYIDKNGKTKKIELFWHMLRIAQQELKKTNVCLIKKEDGWTATKKLYELDLAQEEIRVAQFWQEAKRLFELQKLSKTEIAKALQKQDPEILSEIKDYKFLKKISKEKLEKEKIIIKLRREFVKKIDTEKIATSYLFTTYLSNKYPNYNYQLPERAHIIPVHVLYKKKRLEDIENPFNGLFLDPNTHRLFDQRKIGFDHLYNFVYVKTKKIYAKINKEVLIPERKAFIDEYRKIFPIKLKK